MQVVRISFGKEVEKTGLLPQMIHPDRKANKEELRFDLLN
jgi:hypothetical protein